MKPLFVEYATWSATACIALFLLMLPPNVSAQAYDGLTALEGYKTETFYSEGSLAQAVEMAERCDRVMAFYKEHLDFEPEVTLLVLSAEDWSDHTSFPFYGMPHYFGANTLVVASEDNDFWRSFMPPLESLSEELAARMKSAYADANGAMSMRGFFDLLAIHELGHAYHAQGELTMQRLWMGELFANILLHTYVAEVEPDLLPALTVFPEMVVASTDPGALAFTTLSELEENYQLLGMQHPNNYGWYQCRWHMSAGVIYDEGGVDAFVRLWHALMHEKERLDDEDFAALLADKVHRSVADVPLKWDDSPHE